MATGERYLAHKIVGRAVEQLFILDEDAFDLGLEGARDAHGRLQREDAWVRRPQLQDHPPAVFSGLCDVSDHSASRGLSPALPVPLANPRALSAKLLSLSSTSRLMVPAGNRPSGPRSPALIPVRISIASSTVVTG